MTFIKDGGGSRSRTTSTQPDWAKNRDAYTKQVTVPFWQEVSKQANDRKAQQAYADALAQQQQQAAYGGGYGSGGYSRGGYGGGGYVKPDNSKQKAELLAQKNAAKGALPGYLKAYDTGISGIGRDANAQTGGYTRQINQLLAGLMQAQRVQDRALRTDLLAQGGDVNGLQAASNAAGLDLRTAATAQDMYNRRLAQMMAAATADRRAAGRQINLSAQSGIDQSYLAALAALGG